VPRRRCQTPLYVFPIATCNMIGAALCRMMVPLEACSIGGGSGFSAGGTQGGAAFERRREVKGALLLSSEWEWCCAYLHMNAGASSVLALDRVMSACQRLRIYLLFILLQTTVLCLSQISWGRRVGKNKTKYVKCNESPDYASSSGRLSSSIAAASSSSSSS